MVAILSSQKDSPNPVRSFYMPEATLTDIAGVGIYQFSTLIPAPQEVLTYPVGSGAFQYFEVSQVSGEGSWWVPTIAVNFTPFSWNNTLWGGITNLLVKGSGVWVEEGKNRVVRPAELFWWVPQGVLVLPTFPLVPAQNDAAIVGSFPQVPPGGIPPKPSVAPTSDGFLITVPPGSETTTVNVERTASASP